MLNPFPDLLMLSFFAPTVLRIAAASMFFYMAYAHIQNREAIARLKFPIGEGEWISWTVIAIELLVGLFLLFGYYTQYAALVGLLGTVKQFVWRGKYLPFFILPRTTSFLLAVVLFSLLISGAGAYAFDLPL